jgi:hypothetical protein
MSKNSKNIITGILLLLVSGAVIVLNIRALEVGFKQLWPVLVLVAGLVLALTAFAGRRRSPLLLAAGTFLCFASVFLLVLAMTGWENLFYLWPGFVLALGMSLAAHSAFGGGKRFWRIPTLVLIAASLLSWVLYTVKSHYGIAVGAAVFLAGGYFLVRGAGLEAGSRPRGEAASTGGETASVETAAEKKTAGEKPGAE